MSAKMKLPLFRIGSSAVAALSFLALVGIGGERRPTAVKVAIQDEKPVVVEMILPTDPTPRVRFSVSQLAPQITTEQGQRLHLSNSTILKIDNQILQAGQGGVFEKQNQPLPKTAGGQTRQGYLSVYRHGAPRPPLTPAIDRDRLLAAIISLSP